MSQDQYVQREKFRVAFWSVLCSLFLTGIKIWAGAATNSLGVLSEALHSGLDFCAAAITFYAVHIAAIPPDKSHPYGHEKVENLSALVETCLLVLTCVWIVWEAVARLFFRAAEINLTWWAFAVVGVSIVVDVERSAMLYRVAKKHKSQALEADALHFHTDVWSSSVVLLGLVCVWLARFTDPGSWLYQVLHKADAVAGLFVAVIILKVSWRLAKASIHALMDGGSDEMDDAVAKALAEQLPQYPVISSRLRESGPKVFIEMTVGMPRNLHVDDAHAVTECVESVVKRVIPEADVLVHVEPQDFLTDVPDDELAGYVALRHDFRLHGFRMMSSEAGRTLKVDIEMPDEKRLGEIKSELEAFENDIKQTLNLQKLVARVQPIRRAIPEREGKRYSGLEPHVIRDKASRVVAEFPDIIRLDSVDTGELETFDSMTVYGTVSGDMSVGESHRLASRMEHVLHHAIPELSEIVVVLRS